MTTNTQFLDFISDITPSQTTISNCKSAHEAVREALGKDVEFCDRFDRTFLGGSYMRSTAIRPRTKNGHVDRPDVDIYVVLKDSSTLDKPSALVDELYNALNRARSSLSITSISRNRCSIAISMNKADIDVCVLLEKQSDEMYRIGNRETGEWYKTNPEVHNDWSKEQNSVFSSRFKPMVKMLKWARRENPSVARHPKSFALEMMLASCMDATETHYGKLFHLWCDNFISKYELNKLLGTVPIIDDPAVSGGNILAGVTASEFSAYYDKIVTHRDRAEKALEETDLIKAAEHWKKIFGDRFPKPTQTNSLKNSASVFSPLSFTTEKSVPSQRPAKFA